MLIYFLIFYSSLSDYIHGFEVDLYELEVKLPDGTKEESTRWITKHGVTLKEVGFIDGSDGKLHFYSEFSNVKVFKQDKRFSLKIIVSDYTKKYFIYSWIWGRS